MACNGKCAKDAGFYPAKRTYKSPTKVDEPCEKPPCEACGGRSRAHKDVDGKPCPLSSEGLAAARIERMAQRPNCSKCGGKPGRGKGWKHREVSGQPCPLSTAGKLAALKAKTKAAKKDVTPVATSTKATAVRKKSKRPVGY